MTDQTIRPIETVYRGYRFRSRLEARWAVFFQTLGVPWEYEPEGCVLSTGEWYLPDFRIQLGPGSLWAEVKPRGADAKLFVRFITKSAAGTRGTVLHGIPDPKILESEGPWRKKGMIFTSTVPTWRDFLQRDGATTTINSVSAGSATRSDLNSTGAQSASHAGVSLATGTKITPSTIREFSGPMQPHARRGLNTAKAGAFE
jgi:hypothetical protein